MNTLELLKQKLAQKADVKTVSNDTLRQSATTAPQAGNPNFDYVTWQTAKEQLKNLDEILSKFEGMFQKLETRPQTKNPKGWAIKFVDYLYKAVWSDIRQEFTHETEKPIGQLYRLTQDSQKFSLLFGNFDGMLVFIKGEKFAKNDQHYQGSEFVTLENGTPSRYFWAMGSNSVGWLLSERFDIPSDMLKLEGAKRFDAATVALTAHEVLSLFEKNPRHIDRQNPAHIVNVAKKLATKRDTVKRLRVVLAQYVEDFSPTAQQLRDYHKARKNSKAERFNIAETSNAKLKIAETETV